MAWFAYPEDEGTTGSTTETDWDWNSSANLGTLIRQSHLTDYVVTGFGLTYDDANNEITVDVGIARFTDTAGAQDAAAGTDRPWGMTYIAGNDASFTYSTTGSDTYEVYLTFDPTGGDNVSYEFITDGTTPSTPFYEKLGEVDEGAATTTDTATRLPDATLASIDSLASVSGSLTGGVTLDTIAGTNLSINSGSLDVDFSRYTDSEAESAINNDGDHGSTAAHNYTGNNEVYGLLLTDTKTNRPAASIAERYFFATDEGVLYRDTGSAWNVAGVTDAAIKSGGAQAVDASEFDGSAGTSGQFLQTDGSTISWADLNAGVDVEDDGSVVVSGASAINFGNNVSVTDDGDGTVTVDASGGGGSSLIKQTETTMIQFLETFNETSFTYPTQTNNGVGIGITSNYDQFYIKHPETGSTLAPSNSTTTNATSMGYVLATMARTRDGEAVFALDSSNGYLVSAHQTTSTDGLEIGQELSVSVSTEFIEYHNDHVYFRDGSTLYAYNVSDPTNMSQVGTVDVSDTNGYGIEINPDTNVLYTQVSSGFKAVDISDPTAMSVLGSGSDSNTSQPRGMEIDNTGTYLAQPEYGGSRVAVWDVSDPTAPVLMDTAPINGESGTSAAWLGDRLYVGTRGGVAVVDASDKSALSLISFDTGISTDVSVVESWGDDSLAITSWGDTTYWVK